MAWPTPAWTAALVLLPTAASLAWGLTRLRGEDGGWPARRVLALVALAWLPAAGSVLLLFKLGIELASPVGVQGALVYLAFLQVGFAGLTWAASHPRVLEHVGLAVGVAGMALLLGGSLAAVLLPDQAPGGTGPAGFAPGVLAVAALAGPAAHAWSGHEDRVRWLGPAALAVLLVPWSALGAGFTLVELTAANTGGPAEYRWGVRAAPSGNGTYAVEVPFPVVVPGVEGADGDPSALLAQLRDSVHVAEGEAFTAWLANGTRLLIEADEPVTVRGTYAFYGDIGDREAFGTYALENATVVRGPGGPANLTVSWTVGFSGGQGHTCWGRGGVQLDLAPKERASLIEPPEDGSGREGPVRAWSVACA